MRKHRSGRLRDLAPTWASFPRPALPTSSRLLACSCGCGLASVWLRHVSLRVSRRPGCSRSNGFHPLPASPTIRKNLFTADGRDPGLEGGGMCKQLLPYKEGLICCSESQGDTSCLGRQRDGRRDRDTRTEGRTKIQRNTGEWRAERSKDRNR